MDDYKFILVEQKGPVLDIWFNRPEARNAMHEPLEIEFYDALTRAEENDEIKVITLRGKGPDFSAGHDLKEAAERYRETGTAVGGIRRGRVPNLYPAWYSRKTLIAGVHGFVGPAAWHLLDCFDFVIALGDTRFSFEQARMGAGDAGLLHSFLFPMRVMKQLWLLGGWLDGDTAKKLHYVHRTVASTDELATELERWAEAACALSSAQIAAHKESIHRRYEIMGLMGIIGIGNKVSGNVREGGENLAFYDLVAEKGIKEALSFREGAASDPSVTKV